MAPAGSNTQDESAKHMFDRIGEKVYDKVKEEAENYIDDLKGLLTSATLLGVETGDTTDTCTLVKQYYDGVNKGGGGKGERYPCTELSRKYVERFSDKIGGQCTNKKIKGNEYNKTTRKDCGACAPYRRLHLCHHNLESINTDKIDSGNAKHNLLLEVCMAAKYEGDSINTHYTKHEHKYKDTGTASQLCTVLARSFADIGDIVRGRDLFHGNPQESAQRIILDDKLKKIFQQIHEGLNDKIKSNYDDNGGNYYKLREDWWTANRATIWEALTCDPRHKAEYFRRTCGSDENTATLAKDKCRCQKKNGEHDTDQVPTYFDYVPQYLRWFEEWAEDFCRKKNKKLKDVETNCRGQFYDKPRYCSGNGYDCEETINKKGHLVMGKDCTKCSVWCRLYEKWIDNQKKEFLKQKNKYEKEMQKYTNGGGGSGDSSRQTRRARSISTDDNGYEKKFYAKLKDDYGTVDDFLGLLNNEKACQDIKETEEKIDFTENHGDKNSNNKGTFYHSQYCQPCPDCGVKRKGEKWENKPDDDKCKNIKLYTPKKGVVGTPIEILKSGEKQKEIAKNLKAFCAQTNRGTTNAASGGGSGVAGGVAGGNSDSSLYDPWICYKHDEVEKVKREGEEEDEDEVEDDGKLKGAGGLCILENKNKKNESGNNSSNEPAEFQKTFNEFFYFWIGRFLNDSMYWRGKVNSCISNGTTMKCRNGCNNDCDCFERWIGKKKTEWTNIKEHFKTQDFGSGGGILGSFMSSPSNVLKFVLKLEDLFENIKSGYGDVKETEAINKILEEEKQKSKADDGVAPGNGVNGGENNTTIDKLLNHEEGIAKNCKQDCEQPKEDKGLGRSATDTDVQPASEADTSHVDDEEEEDEDEDEVEEEAEEVQEEKTDESATEAVAPSPPGTTQDGVKPASQEDDVKVCSIVDKALKGKLDDACTLKYGKTAPTSWKCIPSDTKSVATTGSDTTGSGSICVPPRRRKLYVGKLHDWAGGETTEAKSQETSGGQKTPSGNESSPSEKLPQGPTPETTKETPESSLLHAFVESAAVETFFAWHKFKEQWKAQHGAGATGQQTIIGTLDGGGEETPDKLLKTGHIPPDFLRQMFYTLGDYRDILVRGGGNNTSGTTTSVSKDTSSGSNNNNIVLLVSENQDEKQKMENIQKAIEKILPKNDTSSGQPGGKPGSHSVKTPQQTWWDENAKHIWHGMICALTYKTDTASGQTPTQNDTVKGALFGEKEGKNTLKDTYTYDKVTFIGGAPSSGISLSDFATVPHFIRWFEEWAEQFCRKREYKLKKAKKECRGEHGDKYFDGEGHDCKQPDGSRNDSFIYLHSSGCQKECIKYKKWIVNKRYEFNKQKKKFQSEIKNLDSKNQNTYDEEVYKILKEKYPTFQNFVERLNENPYCIKSNIGGKIDFKKNGETFGSSEYCKACPVYGVNCNNRMRKCEPIDEKEYKTKKGIIAENENDQASNIINVLVLDRKGDKKNNNFINDCNNTGLFEDASVQNWECQKINGVDQCKLTNFSGDIDDDQNMEFNVFFQQWLRYFVHDYNKLKDKIKACIKNGNKKEDKCIKGCKKNCECVKEWLKIKEGEWQKIKTYYDQKKKMDDYGIPYWVMSYFQQLPFDDYKKAQEVVESKDERERYKLWGCTGDNIENRDKKTCEDGDFISNLITELQQKITTCQTKHDETSPNTCDDFPTQTYIEPLDPDDNHHHHIQQPNFCPPPMTCVEKIAKELRVEAEGKVNDELKGTGLELKEICNKVQKNAATGEESCDFKTTYENSVKNINNECERMGIDRLKVGQEWNCKYIKDIKKELCIPPRRKDMCIKELNKIGGYNVNNSTDLLQKLQKVAQNEGDDIIRKLLKQNSCDEHRICDAMKYSFADLADIIRGRDLLKNYGDQLRIQRRLINAFTKIYSNLKGSKKKKYQNDITNLYELRSDWWDANRESVWKAMTCNAPEAAKLNKRSEEPEGTSIAGSFVSPLQNCGHDKDPPDYDYIPQPFRWMQEWSEYYCKLLNEQIKKFETECEDCKNHGMSCKDDVTGTKCEKCRKQCDKYTQVVHQWEKQFGKYKEIYNYLYNNDINTDNKYTNEYFKNFVKKLKHECNGKDSADKYLDKASHCKKYKFTNNSDSNNNDNYAFKNPPKEYEKACECDAPDPLDQCPNNEGNKGACKKLSVENECKNKNLINDDNWSAREVKDSTGNNEGVLVPPRRRHLCLRNITSNRTTINNKNIFKNELLKSAYSEGYYLWDKYKYDSTKLLDVMRYSFYDYGDIVKGTDMMDNYLLDQLKTKIDEVLKDSTNNDSSSYRGKWWNENKEHVWHAMICGYQTRNGYESINASWCTLPTEVNNSFQFLRWFREWTESFCFHRKKLYNIMVSKCNEAECDETTGRLSIAECTQACREYENYIFQKKQEYFGQLRKYDRDFKTLNENKDAPYYFKSTFFSRNYDCLFDNFKENVKWEKPYDTIEDKSLKNK
ncbi:hypothetical protein PFUGPA_05946, partial [Plasmodium falciparum Palo Alto/Uganda]